MAYCSRCELIRWRLRRIPDSAGDWGRFLAAVVAASWAAALWHEGHGIGELAGIGTLVSRFGRTPVALWMSAVAMVPIVDALTDLLLLRVLGATLGLVTWTSLLFEVVLQGDGLCPATGSCLVGLLGCLNADIGLARQVAGGRQ
jgi:hypothetical protein